MLLRYDGSLSGRYRTSAGFFNLPCGMVVPPSFGRRYELGLSQSLRRPSVLKALCQREPGAAPQAELSDPEILALVICEVTKESISYSIPRKR